MEDAVVAMQRFFGLPLWALTGSNMVDRLDPISFRLPVHFFFWCI
jgi:protein phosphatase 2C